MTAAAQQLPLSDLYCHAEHTDPRRRRLGLPCNRPLGRFPGEFEFITTAQRMPPALDGRAWVQCPKCGRWNGFRILAIVQPRRHAT